MSKLRLSVSDAPPRSALAIYLRDHLGGAAGGVSLARRIHRNNLGTPYAGVLADVAQEIAEDEAVLRRVMSHLGVAPSQPKRFLALTGERAARLKLNGQLRGYSRLARVAEIEVLSGGIQAKRYVWRSLAALSPSALPADVDLAELEDRARSQLERLRELHRAAAEEAFAAAAPAA